MPLHSLLTFSKPLQGDELMQEQASLLAEMGGKSQENWLDKPSIAVPTQ